MGEARQKALENIQQLGISREIAEALTEPTEPKPAQQITNMRVLQSVRFNRTENVSLSSSREKCSFRTAPEGVYVTGECPTILIPWSNIAWVELK